MDLLFFCWDAYQPQLMRCAHSLVAVMMICGSYELSRATLGLPATVALLASGVTVQHLR